MLLSLKHNFLFVHIAKTGGTSIRQSLLRQQWNDPYRIPLFLCSRISRWTGHKLGIKFPRHAKAIAAQEMLPRELYDQLFKFAFVRNPWDLQVSSWHHLRRERPHLVEHCKSFSEFIRYKLDPEREYQFHIDTSIEWQSDYLIDLHGKLIVDFVGRYEHLAENYLEVCERIGIKPPKLLHKREAKDRDKDYRSYYDADTAERVARYFEPDISRFDYQFDPETSR